MDLQRLYTRQLMDEPQKQSLKCKRGCVNLSDEFRDGRPSTAVNKKNIDTVYCTIETERHVIYHEIRASLDIEVVHVPTSRAAPRRGAGRT
ncbi:hypothetical protein EVAR_75894_1 [Eumeta japonica]|uniref:Uncharacterized protein n=1 Tax=Eumeta variegata TaxID=151549 RepID=A0A4C1UW04_EUMVA|nr:hypothetical protein EVAR_75894_1 [Eumeta japonica]